MGEYYCFLALSIEAEETLIWQRAAVSGNFDMKKWPHPKDNRAPQTASIAPVLGKIGGIHSASQLKPTGSAETYAQATGRLLVFYDPKVDKYFTEEGEEVDYDETRMVRMLIGHKKDKLVH